MNANDIKSFRISRHEHKGHVFYVASVSIHRNSHMIAPQAFYTHVTKSFTSEAKAKAWVANQN